VLLESVRNAGHLAGINFNRHTTTSPSSREGQQHIALQFVARHHAAGMWSAACGDFDPVVSRHRRQRRPVIAGGNEPPGGVMVFGGR